MLFRNEKDKKDDREPTGTPSRVPLLPLRDIIVFPHMVVPLFAESHFPVFAKGREDQ
jgi:ATP-dependent Lon protease